ncbi:MAG: SIR2 family protein, partial [Azoarcus sp.]|nr:SIR2 family protein [Azoarcus sp.]
MQFVRNGPDIPERLLQAHEDGHVVLFCGAGISYPAGLPGFSGLVEQIYESLSIEPNQVQQAALDAKQFDTAINLLEANMVEGRTSVRQELAKILLHPDLTNPDATATHEALLTLARNREGKTRLVTTNFDRLFEHVTASKSPSIPSFQAPLLHVPKQRWDGLVYLHGLLSEKPTPGELDQLVVSSGDFGLAYLIEGWAAHFVSRLFRNYTVCFVGYSINDPIPRYMMDALAADHILGESSPEMFAFGDFSEERETECANEWKAKNVTPILYCKDEAHTCLHETLRAWADTYRDGVRGKERIVDRYAADHPSKSTKQDNFVGRMLWALSDPSGLPAKRFADMDPVPPLDWLLGPLSEERYKHADLSRFGVPAQTPTDKDKYLKFSLIRRPSPYTRAPWMVITGARNRGSEWNEWDETMFHLARWLTRHLDDPKLVWWLVERGCQLHPNLVELIDRRLNELARLESIGSASDKEELKRICENAPNAIPRPVMRTLWRLLLTGRVYPGSSALNLYHWHDQFRHEGLTVSTRIALREILTPYVS